MAILDNKTYKIHNLVTPIDSFNCCGYTFTKVKEYNERIKKLYRPTQIIRTGGKTITKKGKAGSFQHTFNAVIIGHEEPYSVLIRNLQGDAYKKIEDIIILLKFLTCSQVCLQEDKNLVLPMHLPNPFKFKKMMAFLTRLT